MFRLKQSSQWRRQRLNLNYRRCLGRILNCLMQKSMRIGNIILSWLFYFLNCRKVRIPFGTHTCKYYQERRTVSGDGTQKSLKPPKTQLFVFGVWESSKYTETVLKHYLLYLRCTPKCFRNQILPLNSLKWLKLGWTLEYLARQTYLHVLWFLSLTLLIIRMFGSNSTQSTIQSTTKERMPPSHISDGKSNL